MAVIRIFLRRCIMYSVFPYFAFTLDLYVEKFESLRPGAHSIADEVRSVRWVRADDAAGSE